MKNENLEGIVNKEKFGRESIVDTLGGVSYSLISGSLLDYCTGLNFYGVLASRASATAMNSVTSAPYGKWRNLIYKILKTNKESSKIKKFLTDLLAFNTFQVPIYAAGIAMGSLVSEGKVDWDKVKHGSEYLTTISPLIAPTMGIYMDYLRRIFKIKAAAEKVN